MRRAKEPLSQGFSRATRRGGLVIRSGRAAHETTLAGFEGRPGARHLYGEVFCEAIEQLQRDALDEPRPELVVKVDRSGLNEHHPIVAAPLRRRSTGCCGRSCGRGAACRRAPDRRRPAVTARDQVGLRALNDLLKAAFDQPGSGGRRARRRQPASKPPTPTGRQPSRSQPRTTASPRARRGEHAPRRRRRRRRRCGSSSRRSGFTPARSGRSRCSPTPRACAPGTDVEIEADPGLTVHAARRTRSRSPAPAATAPCRSQRPRQGHGRARLALTVLAAAGEHTAELEIVIVRHRASGWVREIARKNEDQLIEAEFDPETAIVTVYEGRREFRELERAARRAGYSKKRAPEYVPYRMLEVEAAANAVYAWAAEQILARRLPEERPIRPRRVRGRRPPRSTRRSATVPTTSSCRRSSSPRSSKAPSPSPERLPEPAADSYDSSRTSLLDCASR